MAVDGASGRPGPRPARYTIKLFNYFIFEQTRTRMACTDVRQGERGRGKLTGPTTVRYVGPVEGRRAIRSRRARYEGRGDRPFDRSATRRKGSARGAAVLTGQARIAAWRCFHARVRLSMAPVAVMGTPPFARTRAARCCRLSYSSTSAATSASIRRVNRSIFSTVDICSLGSLFRWVTTRMSLSPKAAPRVAQSVQYHIFRCYLSKILVYCRLNQQHNIALP